MFHAPSTSPPVAQLSPPGSLFFTIQIKRKKKTHTNHIVNDDILEMLMGAPIQWTGRTYHSCALSLSLSVIACNRTTIDWDKTKSKKVQNEKYL